MTKSEPTQLHIINYTKSIVEIYTTNVIYTEDKYRFSVQQRQVNFKEHHVIFQDLNTDLKDLWFCHFQFVSWLYRGNPNT